MMAGKRASLIGDYKFKSIFWKNMRNLFVLVLIPLMGAVIVTVYTQDKNVASRRDEYCREEGIKAVFSVDEILRETQSHLTYISQSGDMQNFIYGSTGNTEYSVTHLYELIRLTQISCSYIRDICVFDPQENRVFNKDGITSREKYLYQSSLADIESVTEGELRLSAYGLRLPEKQLSLYHLIKLGNTTFAYGVANINPIALARMITESGSQVTMISGEIVVASNDVRKLGSQPEDWMNENAADGEIFLHDGSVYISELSENYDYCVILKIDQEKYDAIGSRYSGAIAAFLLLMFTGAVYLCYAVSKNMYRPVRNILALLEKNQTLLTGEDILQSENEIKYIETAINRTIYRSRDIQKELEERIEKLKKAQCQALQSQIDPHFINNTLDLIRWSAVSVQGLDGDIVRVTEALSGLMRATLEKSDAIITIREEMEHAEKYLLILQMRYPGRMEVRWNIPEDMKSCKIIRIVLQPLIENVFRHGIRGMSTPGLIRISGESDVDSVTLAVEDNGLGMSGNQLKKTRERMGSNDIEGGGHIGLNNVNQRLQLYFGEAYGLNIESEEYVGTKVSIRIPRIKA